MGSVSQSVSTCRRHRSSLDWPADCTHCPHLTRDPEETLTTKCVTSLHVSLHHTHTTRCPGLETWQGKQQSMVLQGTHLLEELLECLLVLLNQVVDQRWSRHIARARNSILVVAKVAQQLGAVLQDLSIGVLLNNVRDVAQKGCQVLQWQTELDPHYGLIHWCFDLSLKYPASH